MLSLDRREITQGDFAVWIEERSISEEQEGQ